MAAIRPYSPDRTDLDNLVLLAERLCKWSYDRIVDNRHRGFFTAAEHAETAFGAYSEMLSHITRYRDANR